MAILKFLNENHEWEQVDVVSDGVTFIPSIAEDGTLSWSNNGSLQNPDPVMLDSNSVVIRDTKEEFPTDGNINLLYLERTNNDFYRWDSVSRKYIKISSGGGGSVDISDKPGNILTYDDDHKLYVPASSGTVEISEKDDNILTFDEDNKLYVPKEEIKISEDEGNAIESRDNGLYVSISDSAEEITYDNTTSELEATNVQDAIDELTDKISQGGGSSSEAKNINYIPNEYVDKTNVQSTIDILMGIDRDLNHVYYLTVSDDENSVTIDCEQLGIHDTYNRWGAEKVYESFRFSTYYSAIICQLTKECYVDGVLAHVGYEPIHDGHVESTVITYVAEKPDPIFTFYEEGKYLTAANPEIEGTEEELVTIQIGNEKFKIPNGGPGSSKAKDITMNPTSVIPTTDLQSAIDYMSGTSPFNFEGTVEQKQYTICENPAFEVIFTNAINVNALSKCRVNGDIYRGVPYKDQIFWRYIYDSCDYTIEQLDDNDNVVTTYRVQYFSQDHLMKVTVLDAKTPFVISEEGKYLVSANPEIEGTEEKLTSIQIGDEKFKIPSSSEAKDITANENPITQNTNLQEQLNLVFGLYGRTYHVQTVSAGANDASIRITCEDLDIDNIIRYDNDKPKYDEIEVSYYNMRWHIKALVPMKYNGVQYDAGQEFADWIFGEVVDFEFINENGAQKSIFAKRSDVKDYSYKTPFTITFGQHDMYGDFDWITNVKTGEKFKTNPSFENEFFEAERGKLTIKTMAYVKDGAIYFAGEELTWTYPLTEAIEFSCSNSPYMLTEDGIYARKTQFTSNKYIEKDNVQDALDSLFINNGSWEIRRNSSMFENNYEVKNEKLGFYEKLNESKDFGDFYVEVLSDGWSKKVIAKAPLKVGKKIYYNGDVVFESVAIDQWSVMETMSQKTVYYPDYLDKIKELEEKISAIIGGNGEPDDSLEEVATGMHDVDGNMIYKRTFKGNTSSDVHDVISTDLNFNTHQIYDVKGNIQLENNMNVMPNFFANGSYFIYPYLTGSDLRFEKGSNPHFTNAPYILTIYYTYKN